MKHAFMHHAWTNRTNPSPLCNRTHQEQAICVGKRCRDTDDEPFNYVSLFKKLLFVHLTEYSIPGTEHMTLIDACRAVHARRCVYRCPCYNQETFENHSYDVAVAMEELRVEAKQGIHHAAGVPRRISPQSMRVSLADHAHVCADDM